MGWVIYSLSQVAIVAAITWVATRRAYRRGYADGHHDGLRQGFEDGTWHGRCVQATTQLRSTLTALIASSTEPAAVEPLKETN